MNGDKTPARPPTLSDILLSDSLREDVIADCELLIERQIQAHQTVSGSFARQAFRLLQRWKPGFVQRALQKLLPEILQAMQPHYETWRTAGQPAWDGYLQQNQTIIINDLLAVSDQRIEASDRFLQGIYRKLRPKAESEIRAALPGLAEILQARLPARNPEN